MKTKERLKTLSFLAPALIIYFIIIVFPTFYSVILSFFDWNGISEKKFIGIKNYVNLFTNDAVFRIALKNNIIWDRPDRLYHSGTGAAPGTGAE